MGKAFHVKSRVPYVRSVLPYRTCERCGIMQRGEYDMSYRDIAWETVRERVYIKSEQVRISRRRSSPIEQLTHALGLRRSRITDRARSEQRTVTYGS